VEILLLFIYCLLLLISSSYWWFKIQRNGWNIENIFLLFIILYYLFIPVNIIIFGGEIYDSSIKSYMVPASRFVSFSSFFITLLFIGIFIFGLAVRGSSYKLVKIYIIRVNGSNLYRAVSYFLALLSFLSLLIYIQQWGGISSFLTNLNLSRAGRFDEDAVGKYVSFGRFIDLSVLPIVYFLYEKRKNRRDWILLLFIPLIIFVFNIFFLSTSKTRLIGLVLFFYFTVSIYKNKLYLQRLLLISIGVFWGVPILDDMFIFIYRVFTREGILAVPLRIVFAILDGSLGSGQYEVFLKDNPHSPYFQFLEYFTYVQMSLQFSLDNSYPLLFFRDFLTGIVKFIPSRLNIQTGIEVQQLNTALFYNYYPEIPALNWGVPPGIISFGMYSLSVPGVIVIAFILGYIFRGVDLFFKSLVEIDRRFSPFYAYVIVVLGIYSTIGIPKEAIYDFGFLVFLVTFFFMSFKFEPVQSEEPVD
jgi:hypothetical protein